MAISYRLLVERADDLDSALAALGSSEAAATGAFSLTSRLLTGRNQQDVSDEVGFPTAASISMRIVNSRSAEATDGIIKTSLLAARALRGCSALYFELDARIFRRMNGTLECYPGSGYWRPERLIWLEHDQSTFVLHDKEYPPEQYRAWECTEGDARSFVIERLDGTEQIDVRTMQTEGRTLKVQYERRNTTMSDATAHILIFVKILIEFLEDRYRGLVDRVEFCTVPTGATAVLPYFSQ